MRVALVHDWLTGMRGGERCLLAFLDLYPEADIFTLLHVPGATSERIDARVKQTSLLQNIPNSKKLYRLFLPLYPTAIKRLDFSGYDLVISLSHAAAKNISVPEGTSHVSFCFTPMRYIWDQAERYFGRATPAMWPMIELLRKWDLKGAQSTSQFVAISKFVAARIKCFYGRHAEVIYPPVDTSWIKPAREGERGAAFLYAGALVPYKRPDLVVDAFNRTGEPLWIVGTGPEEKRLREMAGPNINFFGHVSDEELAVYYRGCRALIFPGTEDFGMVPIECMAAGRPVIGLFDGGLRETLSGVKPWESNGLQPQQAAGVFIRKSNEENSDALIEAIEYFKEKEKEFSIKSCVERAKVFSPERFFSSWVTFVSENNIQTLASFTPKDVALIDAVSESVCAQEAVIR